MTFDRFKAFLADDMLDAAGIFRGGLLINTKAHQAAGEELVALIDHLCDRASAVGQVDVAFRRYADLLFFLLSFFMATLTLDFFKAKFFCNINTAYNGFFSDLRLNSFQIIFCGFVRFQQDVHLVFLNS